MLKAEQIPDEAYEAASRIEDKNDIGAVILAAINAWPGAEYVYRQPHRRAVSYSKPAIILPLPTLPEGRGDSTEASDEPRPAE